MPRRKKTPHEMTDAELLRQVFPPKVAEAIEQEVKGPASDADSPNEDKDK